MTDTSKEAINRAISSLRRNDRLLSASLIEALATERDADTERAEQAEAARKELFDANIEIVKACSTFRTRVAALEGALTPDGDTKAAFIGEFKFSIDLNVEDEDGEPQEIQHQVYVPWDTTKEIMAAIRNYAALSAPAAADVPAGSGWTVTSGVDLQIRGADIAASQQAADRVRAELERLERLDRQSGGAEL